MDFPPELQLEIIAHIPACDLLNLHVTSQYNRDLITPLTHCHLHFCLPVGWKDFTVLNHNAWQWAAAAEILGAIFIEEAWFPVVSVSFNCWLVLNYCFFRFLQNTNVTDISITGFRLPMAYYPHVPYPFMLPPTVKHLTVSRCLLGSHSLIGLLSPGSRLDSLVIDCVDNAFLVSPDLPVIIFLLFLTIFSVLDHSIEPRNI